MFMHDHKGVTIAETKGLLSGGHNDNDTFSSYSAETIYRNFIAMCVAFSINHGCVVACLSYASVLLGNRLGSYASGILYIFFTLTSFFASNPVVATIGPKVGLIIGLLGYSIYIAGFCFAVVSDYVESYIAWFVMCIAAAVGGIAAGLLWTAQGKSLQRHASFYSNAIKMPLDKVNANFAGVFALIFLGGEMATKIFATGLFLLSETAAPYFIFPSYTVLALLAVFVMSALDDLDDKGTWDLSYEKISKDVGAAAKLVIKDRRMALIVPYQLAFGFTSSFVPYYVYGTVIAGSSMLGITYIGVLSSIIALTGTATAIPAVWFANRYGKEYVIFIGSLCLLFSGFAFFIVSDESLGTWSNIIPFLIVYGIGRGIWENTNKAVIVDFFTDEKTTPAFAAASFFSGYGGAMGFFTFTSLQRLQMSGTVMLLSTAGMICYYFAFVSHRQMLNKYNEENQKIALRRIAYNERIHHITDDNVDLSSISMGSSWE